MENFLIALLFAVIAMIYASVGFGGGSSYLAILAMYGMPFREMKFIALLCNIIVVGGGIFIYFRNREIRFQKILPLIILSVPAAWLGAAYRLPETHFYILLGVTLILTSYLLWRQQ